MEQNELMHYGVIGMRWGVRRYQPYGSGGYMPKSDVAKVKKAQAAAGAARARSAAKPTSTRRAKKAAIAEQKAYEVTAKAEAKAAAREKKHKEMLQKQAELPINKAKSMSNEELVLAVERKKKEQEYAKLEKTGDQMIEDALIAGGIAGLTAGTTYVVTKGISAMGATFLNDKLAPEVFKAVFPKK